MTNRWQSALLPGCCRLYSRIRPSGAHGCTIMHWLELVGSFHRFVKPATWKPTGTVGSAERSATAGVAPPALVVVGRAARAPVAIIIGASAKATSGLAEGDFIAEAEEFRGGVGGDERGRVEMNYVPDRCPDDLLKSIGGETIDVLINKSHDSKVGLALYTNVLKRVVYYKPSTY